MGTNVGFCPRCKGAHDAQHRCPAEDVDRVDLALELARVRRLADERGNALEASLEQIAAMRVVLERTHARLARMRTAIDAMRSESLGACHEVSRGLERRRG